jgi:hypothetical protein
LNAVPRSYRAWRDPAALLLGFAAIAAALRIAVARTQRVALALGLVGCTLAAAVYVHQQAVHTFVCLPGYHCPAIMFRPDIWHDSRSLLIMAVGFAAAILLVLPIRWRVAPLLHPRRGLPPSSGNIPEHWPTPAASRLIPHPSPPLRVSRGSRLLGACEGDGEAAAGSVCRRRH